MTDYKAVIRVVVRCCEPDMLEFDVVLPDGSYKPFKLNQYGIRAFRGASPRTIMEQCARDLLDDLGLPSEGICLTFL